MSREKKNPHSSNTKICSTAKNKFSSAKNPSFTSKTTGSIWKECHNRNSNARASGMSSEQESKAVECKAGNGNIQHAKDLMTMVDEWKKEEERLQKDYEEAQQRIRLSVRQEHQAKAEAQNWRVQLEKLGHCHRERLFRQATLLRSQLRQAEDHLASTEQKVKGLAITNSKLKGLIDKANKNANNARRHSEMHREEVKKELKEKLRLVETELQNLTEKISTSGIIDGISPSPGVYGSHCRSKRNYFASKRRSSFNKPPHDKRRTHSQYKNESIHYGNFPSVELSAMQPQYFEAPLPRHMPVFSYNSYPYPVAVMSNSDPAGYQSWPTSSTKSLGGTQSRTHVYNNASRFHRDSDSDRFAYFNTAVIKKPTFVDESISPRLASSEHSNTSTNHNRFAFPVPPSYYSLNSDKPPCDHVLSAAQYHGYCIPNTDACTPVTSSMTSATGPAACGKCHGWNKQRLLVQRREVYNSFARARDRQLDDSIKVRQGSVVRSPATVSPRTYALPRGKAADGVTNSMYRSCTCMPPVNQAAACEMSSASRTFDGPQTEEYSMTSTAEELYPSKIENVYFGDFERSASSLAVLKKRTIGRRTANQNRTR